MNEGASISNDVSSISLIPHTGANPKDILHSVVTWNDDIIEGERQTFLVSLQLDRFVKHLSYESPASGAEFFWIGVAPEYPYVVKAIRSDTPYVAALIREFYVGSCINNKITNKGLKCFVRTLCFCSSDRYVFLVQDRAHGLKFSEWIQAPQLPPQPPKSNFEVWLAQPNVMRSFQIAAARVLCCIKDFLKHNITLYGIELDNVFVEGPAPHLNTDPNYEYKIKFVSYRKAHVPEYTSNSMFYLGSGNDRYIDHAPGLFDPAIDYQLFLTNLYRQIYVERDVSEKNVMLDILPKSTIIPLWPRPESRVMAFVRDVISLPVTPNTGVTSSIKLVEDYIRYIMGLAVSKKDYGTLKITYETLPPHEKNFRTWVTMMDQYAVKHPNELGAYRWRMGEAWNYTWHKARQAYLNSQDYQSLINVVQQWLNFIN